MKTKKSSSTESDSASKAKEKAVEWSTMCRIKSREYEILLGEKLTAVMSDVSKLKTEFKEMSLNIQAAKREIFIKEMEKIELAAKCKAPITRGETDNTPNFSPDLILASNAANIVVGGGTGTSSNNSKAQKNDEESIDLKFQGDYHVKRGTNILDPSALLDYEITDIIPSSNEQKFEPPVEVAIQIQTLMLEGVLGISYNEFDNGIDESLCQVAESEEAKVDTVELVNRMDYHSSSCTDLDSLT